MNDKQETTEAAVGQSELTAGLGTMTDENAKAWAGMGLSKDWQIKRLVDWANMLERRVSELDPLYRAYPFGRSMPKPIDAQRLNSGGRMRNQDRRTTLSASPAMTGCAASFNGELQW